MKNPFRKLWQFASASALAMVLLVMSCQHKDLPQQEVFLEPATIDVQKAVLEFNFNIPVDQMNPQQIEHKYQELMAILPADQQEALVNVFEKALSLTPANNRTAIASKKSETMLSNGVLNDGFGQGVATSGNKVYVGSRNTQEVFEYAKNGGAYTLVSTITPSVAVKDFGYHVSVSGSWMAVSAPEYGLPFPSGLGKVFIFKKQGNSWVEQTILSGPADEGNFGGDGLGLEGTQLAVISRGGGSPSPGGTITVFNHQANGWVQTGSIHKPGYDWFALDMDDSGNRIIGTGPVNNNIGTVRAVIFAKSGFSWAEEDEVIVTPPTPFGYAVPRDVAIDNGKAVLTALIPGNKHWLLSNNNGDWEVEQELNTSTIGFGNRWAELAGPVALIGEDGLGAPTNQVQVFRQSGGAYSYDETLKPADGGAGARIWDLAIDGNTIVLGTPGLFGPGKAYVFD